MKILCVIDSLGSGGAQRQLVELALGFKEIGHDVSFLTYHYIPFYNPILENHGITIECIQEPNYFKRLLKMRSFIRRGKYDAVLSFLEAANFICEFAGLPFRKWKLVVGERSANPNVLIAIKLKMYRWFHFLADYVVANSDANMRIVRSINPIISDSKCKVIHNLVDFDRWKPASNYVPRKHGKLKLTVAAGHRYLKNLNGLVEALSDLSQAERSRFIVEWYGDSEDNSLLDSVHKIKDSHLEEVITFYPATHEITHIFQDSDVIGLFSFYEGFPNAVCEGMACSKPIICSSISDVSTLLEHQRFLLCDPTDNISIREAIIHVLHLSNEELMNIGEQNRICAERFFNKKSIISQYLQLLTK